MSAISSPHLEFMGLVSYLLPPISHSAHAQSSISRPLSAIGDTRQARERARERAFQFRPQNGTRSLVPFSSPLSAFLKIGRISMRATRSRNLRPAALSQDALQRYVGCPPEKFRSWLLGTNHGPPPISNQHHKKLALWMGYKAYKILFLVA